jgi:hypothetical protein
LLWGGVKKRNRLCKTSGGSGRISKSIFKKLEVWTLTGFIWLRNGTVLNTVLILRIA